MGNNGIQYSVFTKPWKLPIKELGEFVKKTGFDGIELPIRRNYPVAPDNMMTELPRAAKELDAMGLKIFSVAAGLDESFIEACGAAGVPVLRVCVGPNPDESYLDMERRMRRRLEELVPLLDKTGVTLGLQNHCARTVPHALGLRRLFEGFDPKHVAAVWDPAHCGLEGEIPEFAIDIVWSHLCMVNLKNAFKRLETGPEAPYAQWKPYWTSGRHGHAPWPEVVDLLKKRGYEGVVCLTAEYSDHDAADRLIAEDIAFAKELFER